MRIIKTRRWIVVIILAAAAFLLLSHLAGNNLEFSRYNTGWNGTSSFFSDLDRHRTLDITGTDQLTQFSRNATLLIIAPNRTPTAEEIAAYRAFLGSGNTLFLADDFGTGNAILTGIGSGVVITPVNLSSLDRKYPDPYTIFVYRAREDGSVAVPPEVALNRPAPLDGGMPLLITSVMSWTDRNGDHRLNMVEDMGSFAVMTEERNGPGLLIVLADPSIFINSMYNDEGSGNNRLLISNLLSRDRTILIDQMNSRTADAAGFSGILQLIRTTTIIELALLSLLLLGTAWAWKKKMI